MACKTPGNPCSKCQLQIPAPKKHGGFPDTHIHGFLGSCECQDCRAHILSGQQKPRRVHIAGVDDGSTSEGDYTPTDQDLSSAGFDVSDASNMSPADRQAAADAYNHARAAMAEASAGRTIDALSAGGAAVASMAMFVPAAAPYILAASAMWSGSLQAVKYLGKVLGWAHAGPGWCEENAPSGPEDSRWKPSPDWSMHVHNDFDRWAVPMLERMQELMWNCRGKNGGAGSDAEKNDYLLGLVKLWNSQHEGPSQWYPARDTVSNTDWTPKILPGSYNDGKGPVYDWTPMMSSSFRGFMLNQGALIQPPRKISLHNIHGLLGSLSTNTGVVANRGALSVLDPILDFDEKGKTPREIISDYVKRYTGKDWR